VNLRRCLPAVLVALAGAGTRLAAQTPDEARLQGRIYDIETGRPLSNVVVEVADRRQSVETDAGGRFSVDGLQPVPVKVRVWKLDYSRADTTISLHPGENTVEIALQPRPISLLSLTVVGEREKGGADVERALFNREVMPGVTGLSGREIRGVPALAEPDVLRSLQAVPGVVALNDLSAQLHVRGGGPDQNLFLLDGARVFAPYHLFGMFGAFNTDAVERVEFFRSALPARYGGALSSVVHVEQRDGSANGTRVEGGASMLGARLTARGALPWAEGRWLVAGRRSHAESISEAVYGGDFPYAFHDLQGRFSVQPALRQRVQGSFFTSSDRFRMFFGGGGEDLHSRWVNHVGSLQWHWTGESWSAATTLWGSRYGEDMVVGDNAAAPPTLNRVEAGGLRVELSRRGRASGFRTGIEVEGGSAAVVGSPLPDSYFLGETRGEYFLPALYGEVERWMGRVRLAPGMRLVNDGRAGRLLLEPRVAGRLHFTEDVALTFGVGRAHQVLSALRDDRNVLPGAPFWFVHPEGTPASRTDGASLALEGWSGKAYSFSAGGYARRFRDVPRWTPAGARDLSGLAFDDGRSLGVEMSARRHAGHVTGWIGYGLSHTRLTEEKTGKEYLAGWDRRHSVDAALFYRPGTRASFSSRMVYGSGMPFWPFVGYVSTPRLSPLVGGTQYDDLAPVWAGEQSHYPAYFRVDLGARYAFRLWGAWVEPNLHVQNVTARQNVLYYRLGREAFDGTSQGRRDATLTPVTPLSFTVVPSLGIDVRF